MALKLYKATTPSQRGLVAVDKSGLYKGRPVKSLTKGVSRTGGRDSYGHKSAANIGGGHKRKYRIIDFKRNKDNLVAVIERIEYCPFRTAHIALLRYEDDTLSYVIAPSKIKVGDKVVSGANVEPINGNCLPLKSIPVGSLVHNVELKPGKGGQVVRSAGGYAQILGRDSGYVVLKLKSGEVRRFLENCRATVGAVSNSDNQNKKNGKAGRSRWKGRKPHVRGVAMNPVDHPHGGGEGKTSGGRHPVSPKGVPTKGYKTRNKKKQSNKYIVSSRHKRK